MQDRRETARARLPFPLLVSLLLALVSGCDSQPERESEPWVSRPVSEWPAMVLNNEIHFADTVFHDLGNAFLIDLGQDTVGVTVKHILSFLAETKELDSIHLGPDFLRWEMVSPKKQGAEIPVLELINENPHEQIGEFNTLKVRDWLVFRVDASGSGVVPLHVRNTLLRRGQTAFAVGRSLANRQDPNPTLTPLRIFENVGPYYYVESLDPGADPAGTSGSPVIDENGHLVGIVAGASGNLGVVAGLEYLKQVVQRYGLPSSGSRSQSP